MRALSTDDTLVRMANQIASVRSYPDDEAVAGIHKHIVAFWTPKMRRALAAYVPTEGSGLDSLAREAIGGKPMAESPVRTARRGCERCGLRPDA